MFSCFSCCVFAVVVVVVVVVAAAAAAAAAISSLRSPIAEQRSKDLEVSDKGVSSFHDRTIGYLFRLGDLCRFSGMAWQSSAIPTEKVGICTDAANQQVQTNTDESDISKRYKQTSTVRDR